MDFWLSSKEAVCQDAAMTQRQGAETSTHTQQISFYWQLLDIVW